MHAPDPGFIVVTGATGGLGSSVVEHLLGLVPASRIAVSVRRVELAQQLALRGVRVRSGDFDDPASLDRAFEGADRVFVISTLAPNDRRFAQQRAAIDAARRAGARSVLYTSILQRRGSVFAATAGHADTEDYLERNDGSYTVVRNSHYVENLRMFLGSALHSGELVLPPDGPTSWVARGDLGEGIARLLVQDFSGRRSLCLTGPRAIDFRGIATIASGVLGHPIAVRTVSPAEYIERLVAQGVAPAVAAVLATGFASRAAGELSVVDAALGEILGRPTRTVEEALPPLLRRATQAS